MLSFSTKGSASGPAVEKVVEALKIAKGMDPDLIIDGELQTDAAIVPSVANLKAPDSKWATSPTSSCSVLAACRPWVPCSKASPLRSTTSLAAASPKISIRL